ncbi:NIBL2 protein, partial [Aramus guarauna]|nr:NIBL2 protein [Aramus guarauna]
FILRPQLSPPPDAALHEGLLSRYDGDSRSWQENYFVLLGDFTLQWFESEEALRTGCEPGGSTALSGYRLLPSPSEYSESLADLCRGLADGSPFADPPGEFLFFLYHPFRRHFCFCATSAGSRRIWMAALGDGVRYRSTELQRRDSLEAEAFLQAVRFYRQERGRYGAEDLFLGPEPEILGNVLMEDLVPVLRARVLPSIRGAERRRRQLWLQFLQEVYTLVLSEISSELESFRKEKEKLRLELEKKIRPDLDQMLTLKDHIAGKLQAVVRIPAESWCSRAVEPHLDRAMEELALPVTSGLEAVRSLVARRVDEVIALVRSSPVAVLRKELATLGETFWRPDIMYPCYEEADAYRDSLRELGERFGFRGTTSLILDAQNLMQRVGGDARGRGRGGMRRRRTLGLSLLDFFFNYFFFGEFYPFSLNFFNFFFPPFSPQFFFPPIPPARRGQELPRYESLVFADFGDIINLENVYEETVLAALLRAVGKGEG